VGGGPLKGISIWRTPKQTRSCSGSWTAWTERMPLHHAWRTSRYLRLACPCSSWHTVKQNSTYTPCDVLWHDAALRWTTTWFSCTDCALGNWDAIRADEWHVLCRCSSSAHTPLVMQVQKVKAWHCASCKYTAEFAAKVCLLERVLVYLQPATFAYAGCHNILSSPEQQQL
jgi:hypothetical protein